MVKVPRFSGRVGGAPVGFYASLRVRPPPDEFDFAQSKKQTKRRENSSRSGGGIVPPGRRFRALNSLRGWRGIRVVKEKVRRDDGKTVLVFRRGRFRFKAWHTNWQPIKIGNRQLAVDAENSNAAAKKVVSRLKKAGVIELGDPEMYGFYITSVVELDPKLAKPGKVSRRTRFYHYEGRFVPRKTHVSREADERRKRRLARLGQNIQTVEYDVQGVAEVSAVEGERFSVPFVDMADVRLAVEKVLDGKTNIRSIQRQSMLDNKPKEQRIRFIKAKLR
jgi:hypothetical protein